jgi:hypothetical protein
VLDIEDTVDPAHGQQELALFNTHAGGHCFQPIQLAGRPAPPLPAHGAYWLHALRLAAPKTLWPGATFTTIRATFVTIAVRVEELKRSIKLAFPAQLPNADALGGLIDAPPHGPGVVADAPGAARARSLNSSAFNSISPGPAVSPAAAARGADGRHAPVNRIDQVAQIAVRGTSTA